MLGPMRTSGVLLHPTSLPGPFGIGDLGAEATRFVEWLSGSGTMWWQVLPLGPTGYGDSPYQSFSAFAGNPYLIDPIRLVELGLVDDIEAPSVADPDSVDFGSVIPWKLELLDAAYREWVSGHHPGIDASVSDFVDHNRMWLRDYALFMAIKQEQGGGSWQDWPADLRLRDPAAISAAESRLDESIRRHVFVQFLFADQWRRLRSQATDSGVRIIGDIPIFVAPDSADVWAHPELFKLDGDRRPTVVAGVPPDYFSETGQLWGNPVYDWAAHEATGYRWWIDRVRHTLSQVDLIRLDHFRGFVDYWEIPAGAETAVTGEWVDGPAERLFDALRDAIGSLPFIAEDLGELHDAVPELRDELELPGMKIVQFGFDAEEESDFLPDRYEARSVAYSGTHDNDTAAGWFADASEADRAFALDYLGLDVGSAGSDVAWAMVEAAWRSESMIAIAPLQDLLGLGSEARMNTPGAPAGNWQWRSHADDLSPELQARLRTLNASTGRLTPR